MNRLPILMYHDVTLEKSKSVYMTISLDKLESQFKYLKQKGYTTLHFSELNKPHNDLKKIKKAIILTFDDVYESQLKYVYPLLKKYNFKACFYVPISYIGKYDNWKTKTKQIMSLDELKRLDSNIVELGHHSFDHKKFHEISLTEIKEDFIKSINYIKESGLKISNVLAYPYGKYPIDKTDYEGFISILKNNKIKYALRIGNRINKFPFKDNFQINRIDIRGEDSFFKFKLKLKFGKIKF